MYKKSIVNICIFYTVLLSVSMLAIFSIIISRDMQLSIEKEKNYIKNQFNVLKSQNEIICSDISTGEYTMQYLHSGDRFAKYKLQTDLKKYVGFAAPVIRLVSVVFPGESTVYSSDGAMTADYFAETLGISGEELGQWLNTVKQGNRYNATDYFMSGSMLNIVTYSKAIDYDPAFQIVTFELDEILNEALSQNTEIYLYKDEALIYGTGSHTAASAKALDGRSTPLYRAETFDTSVSDRVQPLKIVCLVNNFTYLDTYIGLILFDILISALVFAAGIILLRKFTNILYSPVKSLLSAMDEVPEAIEDEFETIKSFIDRIKTENISMQKDIEKKNEEELLTSVILNEADPEPVSLYAESHMLDGDEFCVTILKYMDYESLYASMPEEKFALFRRVIKELLLEKFEAYSYFRVIAIHPESYILVHRREKNDNYFELLCELIATVERKFSLKLCAYIGDEVAGLDRIHTSYNTAVYISQCTAFYTAHRPIYTKELLQQIQYDNFVYPIETEASLISAVLAFDMQKVRENVDFLVSMNSAAAQKHDRFVQLVTMLAATISRIMAEINADSEQIFGEGVVIYLELRQSETFAELADKTVQMLTRIVEYSSRSGTDEFGDLKRNIEEYIENNYQNDISLGDMAEHLNLSETYVSKLFKMCMGKNFKEYVMYYKYKKAKQIMKDNPTYKLKDVARMVGCNTPLTLSRLLKKYDV